VLSRILLYYPTFELPSEQWIKDGLLYWDQVGSIVPEKYQDEIIKKDLRYLKDNGLYKPFDPEPLLEDNRINEELTKELTQRLNSPWFAEEIKKPASESIWKIALEKMAYPVWEEMHRRMLTPDDFTNGWIGIKEPAAKIYMGLLTRFLASKDADVVQPSTDYEEFEDIIYRCRVQQESIPGMALTLKNLLPQVSPETELSKVVEFRNKRKEELLRFRSILDDVQKILTKCESKDDAKLVMIKFQEQLELISRTIHRVMKEQRIRGVVGTLRTILNTKAPSWLALFGASAGTVVGGPITGVITGFSGYAAGTAIELANYYLDARSKDNEQKELPCSYLYYAKKEKIT
jgi:hypothetical protein